MALTPEDVLNKTFGTTQFRRGYDEREVDDFLDEVVATMRRLSTDLDNCRKGNPVQDAEPDAELAEVRAQLDRERALRAEAERAVEQARSAPAPVVSDGPAGDERDDAAQRRIEAATARAEEAESAARARIEAIQAELDAKQAELDAKEAELAQAPAPLAAMESGDAGAPAADASGLIALAQRVHDEYVAEGESTRDRLITEAQTRHDDLVGRAQEQHDSLLAEANAQRETMLREAQDRAGSIVSDAEAERERVLGDLGGQREMLQARIEQLRGFEGDYRGHLRDYLSGRLSDLDALPPVGEYSPDGSGHS